jgi:hypothetical protein
MHYEMNTYKQLTVIESGSDDELFLFSYCGFYLEPTHFKSLWTIEKDLTQLWEYDEASVDKKILTNGTRQLPVHLCRAVLWMQDHLTGPTPIQKN